MDFEIIKRACDTCIYRKDSGFDVRELESQVADSHIDGMFNGYRICHHHERAVCRGFWNRHKDKFAVGQIAQRLGAVVEVDASPDIHVEEQEDEQW